VEHAIGRRRVRSERVVALEALVEVWPNGGRLTYAEIEAQTQVPMNESGKDLLREVLRRYHREWVCQPGQWIEAVSTPTSLQVVQRKMRRSVQQIKRAAEAHHNVEPLYNGLSPDDYRYAQMIGVALGTWEVVTRDVEQRMLSRHSYTDLMQQMKHNKLMGAPE